jgi:hypothetical protein
MHLPFFSSFAKLQSCSHKSAVMQSSAWSYNLLIRMKISVFPHNFVILSEQSESKDLLLLFGLPYSKMLNPR